jgi:hypothetical protein
MSAARLKSIDIDDLAGQMAPEFSGQVKVIDGFAANGGVSDPKTIVAVEGLGMKDLLEWNLERNATQICQVDSGSLTQELNTSAVMLKSPEAFLDMPMACILSPQRVTADKNNEVTKLNLQFRRAGEKNGAIDLLRALMIRHSKPQSLISDACLIADEMFTNAVYNAPFVDVASGSNPGIDRNDWFVEMKKGHAGELMIGYDDERLVIVCRDPFGSLNIGKFLNGIRECCRNGVSSHMKMGPGGAGIGSYLVFNSSSSFYVAVSKGKCTVVAATLQWGWGSRKRSQTPKNLHCIQLG